MDQTAETEDRYLARAAQNIERHRKGDAVIRLSAPDGAPLVGAEVTITQIRHAFHFGCIVFPLVWQSLDEEEEALFKTRFLKLFNFAVFPVYWKRYEQQPGRPAWAELLPTLAWAKAHHLVTKGHPLVWTATYGVPDWLANVPEAWHEDLLRARVFNTVAGFADDIKIWDVVNEFIHLSTWAHKHIEQKAHTTEEVADFVEKALHWANDANPNAQLVLNEFDLVPNRDTFKPFDVPPRERFIRVIRELQHRDAPVHLLGVQAHEPRDEWYPPATEWETFDQLGDLGLPLQITEFTPRSSGNAITGGWREGTWTEQAQADYTEQFLRLSFGHPSVACFNFWGMPDAYAWLSEGGLVDEAYRPKPVYRTLDRLINTEWMTKGVKATTDANGETSVRGFYGTYEVTIRAGARESTFEAEIAKGEDNTWAWTFDV